MSDRRRLEEVLADHREQAAILEAHGRRAQALSARRVCDDVRECMLDYLTWLSEAEAMSRSGRGTEYLRSRFGDWAAQGMAEFRGRSRFYRSCVIPVRHNADLARAEAQRMARVS